MARLSLALLGPFQATLDGRLITSFASNKVRALLAYLAMEADRPHPRDVLAALLWPERPNRAARTNLRTILANLRKAIGDREAEPSFLHITRENIQFNRQSGCWFDVAAFMALLEAECRAPPAAGQRLEEAMSLYRGPFLEGFSLRDSPDFDDWSLLIRERLHRQASAALQRLVEEYERSGDLRRACEAGRRWVELEPWEEEAHRELMRLLALSGQRSAALAQYEACRRALRAELGVEPTEETVALHQRIRDEGQIASSIIRGPPHNLPAPLIPFVGREQLLATVGNALRDPTCRLLSLVGPGGSGKTRLALEAARQEAANFRHGVCFVPLAPLQSIDGIVPALSQALNLLPAADAQIDPRRQLLDYLREKQMLVLLDNFEHLLDGVGLVIQILRAAPRVKVMATSRVRLRAQGEYLLSVPGLDVPPGDHRGVSTSITPSHTVGDTPQDVSRYEAVELFLQGARRVQAGFEPSQEELVHVARLCQMVEGLPLAVLLASSWVRMLAPAEIAEQLAACSLDFLDTGWRDVPPRQRSMRAVLDHSWSLLAEREREILSALSVFRGGFLSEASREVTGASLEDLVALLDRSLLQRTAEGRYEVHELVRQYAAERLRECTVTEERIRDRHCAYYAMALQRRGEDLRGPRQREALEEMAVDADNARAAWDWAVQQGNVGRMGEAIDGLCRFYERQGRFQEGEAACRLATEKLQAMQEEPGSDGLRMLARALTWQALFSQVLGRTELSEELLQQGLALLDSPRLIAQDTRAEKAFALEQLGHTIRRSDRGEARQLWEESLDLYQGLQDHWQTANLLVYLGEMCLDAGDYAQGERLFEEGLALRREMGDRRGIGQTLLRLVYASNMRTQIERGERLAREAMDILWDVGDRPGALRAQFQLAIELQRLGGFDEGHRLAEEVVVLHEDLGMRYLLAREKQMVAWFKTNLGLYEEACLVGQEVLGYCRAMGHLSGVAWCLCGLAQAAEAQGEYVQACELLRQSLSIMRNCSWEGCTLVLIHLGHVERALGQHDEARRHLAEALQRVTEIRASKPVLFSLSLFALLLADRGETERAIEVYALATRDPYAANSRYWEDRAGKHIAAAAATLPPQVVAAAQARGRARDLEATIEELLKKLEPPKGRWSDSEGGCKEVEGPCPG